MRRRETASPFLRNCSSASAADAEEEERHAPEVVPGGMPVDGNALLAGEVLEGIETDAVSNPGQNRTHPDYLPFLLMPGPRG